MQAWFTRDNSVFPFLGRIEKSVQEGRGLGGEAGDGKTLSKAFKFSKRELSFFLEVFSAS